MSEQRAELEQAQNFPEAPGVWADVTRASFSSVFVPVAGQEGPVKVRVANAFIDTVCKDGTQARMAVPAYAAEAALSERRALFDANRLPDHYAAGRAQGRQALQELLF